MADLIKPQLLKGFRDFLPETMMKRKEMIFTLERTFEFFGFVPIDTPVLEYTEILLGKGGGETDKQVYRFNDHGNRDVSLRYDLTVPFARFIAGNVGKLYLPFKRYHIGKVWRGENTQRGRYREFTQCDFDIVGVDSAPADYEILFLMYRSFKALGIKNVRIHFSNRGLFNSYLEKLGISDKSVDILRIIDKLSKVGADSVKEMLGEFTTPENIAKLLEFIQPEKESEATLEKVGALLGHDDQNVQRMRQILDFIGDADLEQYFFIDTSITRGLDYYTGIVFETFLTDLPGIGSVCSGGRYNDLSSLYTKQEIPGVGASIGLDRLYAALEELNGLTEAKNCTKVLILCLEEDYAGYYQNLAEEFRAEGLETEVFPVKKKMSVQFAYAEKKGIRVALICGEDERAEGKVVVKDLEERANYDHLSVEKAIDVVKEILE